MLERSTLHVLAALAEIGLPEALNVPVATFDPILRPLLRKSVKHAIAEATNRADSMPVEHVLRLAFVLRHADCPTQLHANDERAVLQAYRKLSAPFTGIPADQALRPGPGAYRTSADPHADHVSIGPTRKARLFWPITSPLVALTLAGAMGVAAWYAAPYFVPTPEERFRKTALGKTLDEPLTDYVSQVGHHNGVEAKARLLTPEVEREIGSRAFTALEKAVDLVPETTVSFDPSVDSASGPLFASLNALNGELYEAHEPALVLGYVQGGAPQRAVWLTSYFVERRDELTIDGVPMRTAWGRRIDALNLVDDALYKAYAEDWTVLSVDRVEEELVKLLLAPMANGAPLGPREYDVADKSPKAELARVIGPLLAQEMEAKAHVTSDDATRALRALLARNAAAFDLGRKGYSLEATSRLQLPPWLVRRLLRAKAEHPGEGALLDEVLRTNDRMAVYRQSIAPAVHELAFLEEEEFTGRLYYEQHLGDAELPRLGEAGATKKMRAVASAELALLTRPQSCPRLALWRVASMAYDPLSSGDFAIGVVLAKALYDELGIPVPEAAAGADEAYARILEHVMGMPENDVRAAALRAYVKLFDAPPPALTRTRLS
jgi:hypothetical protein